MRRLKRSHRYMKQSDKSIILIALELSDTEKGQKKKMLRTKRVQLTLAGTRLHRYNNRSAAEESWGGKRTREDVNLWLKLHSP